MLIVPRPPLLIVSTGVGEISWAEGLLASPIITTLTTPAAAGERPTLSTTTTRREITSDVADRTITSRAQLPSARPTALAWSVISETGDATPPMSNVGVASQFTDAQFEGPPGNAVTTVLSPPIVPPAMLATVSSCEAAAVSICALIVTLSVDSDMSGAVTVIVGRVVVTATAPMVAVTCRAVPLPVAVKTAV